MKYSLSQSCRWISIGRCSQKLPAVCLALALFGAITRPVEAQLGSRPAEAWIKTLESSHRVTGLKIDETITKLDIKPGDRIADIGAGSGLYCPPLARAVSPGGRVYAVDIEPGLIDHIANRARELDLTNIVTVLGQFTDPNLPVHNLDLACMFDVLHHIEHRAEYLRNLVHYLKPTGRIAVVDFHPERGPHRDDPALQITKDQTDDWMASIGFKPMSEFELFDDKWFVVYARSPIPPP